jgi:hypothetical protein
MLKPRCLNGSSILEFNSETEALNLRKQAEGMPVSIRRDELLRKANQAETTAQVSNGPREKRMTRSRDRQGVPVAPRRCYEQRPLSPISQAVPRVG